MRRLSVLLLTVALAAVGCSTDAASSEQPPSSEVTLVPADPPAPFHAASTQVPDGASLAQCSDLRGPNRNSGLAVRFVVPAGYSAYDRNGATCDFTAATFGTEFYISFEPHPTLKSEKERDLDPREDEGGDDSVSDISYAADVPVFGTQTGERLDYYCYCDGQELDYRVGQARGVRLTWITPHGRRARRVPAYDAVTASMALIRSDRSTCHSRGRTALFRPPIPQTQSIDFYGDRCHVYLRPGRASLHRYAEIELSPRLSLAERAERLRGNEHVVSVRYEPGAAALRGRRADRLTWVVVPREARGLPGPHGSLARRLPRYLRGPGHLDRPSAPVADRGRRRPTVLPLRARRAHVVAMTTRPRARAGAVKAANQPVSASTPARLAASTRTAAISAKRG